MTYRPPVNDILRSLKTALDFDQLIESGVYDGLDEDTVAAILDEAGRFGADVLAPLNWTGDQVGTKLNDGVVSLPDAWKGAYDQFVSAGWTGLPCAEEHGGQALPSIVSMAVNEIWNSANMSFGTCPLLTHGAIHAIEATGSDALKQKYLPRMVSGEWTGTMNLTEPQAGSDLRGIKAKAVPQDDGTYRVSGTKIFITYGEHSLTDNIIHLVLARLPDAPEGTRGISLFLVPKFLVNEDGSLGARNDIQCVGIEKKLGIHASPTCVMSFGDGDGAVGYLVGEENRGLNAMFVMMNQARLAVGVQGVAVAERAMQRATDYAHERKQGHAEGMAHGEMAPIVSHPDVRRMLIEMRAKTQAARCICLVTASELDKAERLANAQEKQAAADKAALLTPIAKAFSTDIGCEVASLGVQIHGGMGFVEETGAAQYYRDARILPIYEGTNGIQAIDLVTRKLPLQAGKVIADYLTELGGVIGEVEALNGPEFGSTGQQLRQGFESLQSATDWVSENLKSHSALVLAGATPYLRLFALVAGGVYLAKAGLSASRGLQGEGDDIMLARYFAETHVTACAGLAQTVMHGGEAILKMSDERLSA